MVFDTTEYMPRSDPECLATYGIDAARPYVPFLGRMTRQKGLRYLLEAVPYLAPEAQVVLCAGAVDTPEMGQELEAAVTRLQQQRPGVIWIPTMVHAAPVLRSTRRLRCSVVRRSTSLLA